MSNHLNSIKCIKCDLVNFGSAAECKRCNAPLDTLTIIANKKKEFEYKVLTQKDRFFAGKFNPEKLEGAINAYASEGWRVISATTASIPALTSNREEMVIIMERERR
jgi:hypothetical protein